MCFCLRCVLVARFLRFVCVFGELASFSVVARVFLELRLPLAYRYGLVPMSVNTAGDNLGDDKNECG